MDDKRALAALIFTVIVWGVSPVFIRTLSVELGPAHWLVIRYAFTSLVFAVLLTRFGGWRIGREDWPRLLVISLFGMLGYNLGSVYGFERIGAGMGGLIIATQPLLIALLAAIFLSERLSLSIFVGLALALAGTVLLVSEHVSAEGGGDDALLGSLFIFLSGLAWAFYVVLSKPLITRYGAMKISAISIIIQTLPLLALADAQTFAVIPAMTGKQWFDMAFMIVVSTFGALLTWNYAVARLPTAICGTFLYLVPLLAVISGALLLGEMVTMRTILGGALILAGVAAAQSDSLRRMARLRRM